MEPIITILIAVVVFAFQVYSNFKKEQEKARNRKQQGPPPLPPLPEENAQRPIPVGEANERQHVPAEFEDYSGTVDVEKMKRLRNVRKSRAIPHLEVIEEDPVLAASDQEVEFDLRKAVIQSAILERPYQ